MNKYVNSSNVRVNQNFIDINFKITKNKYTYTVVSHVSLLDTMYWITSINNFSLFYYVCQKSRHQKNDSIYYNIYYNRFPLGKGSPFENRIEIKTIDDLVNKIDILDSVLNTLPEYPDSNSVYRSFDKYNNEYYYFKMNIKKHYDITAFHDTILKDTARFKFCNCK